MKTTKPKLRKIESSGVLPLYQLKVTLRDVKPLVWRRLKVRGDTTLARLHAILQAAMGWYNCHLHTFTIRGLDYSLPDPEWDVQDERKVTLSGLGLSPKDRLCYTYDMGDGWEHDVVIEAVKDAETRRPPRAVCLAGARRCPPEDVGGSYGYQHFRAVMRNPRHEEHEELREWIGGDFNPEAFDVAETNEALERV